MLAIVLLIPVAADISLQLLHGEILILHLVMGLQ
jgi:hypothetical protein